MTRKLPFIASHEDWLEEFGEVELIGGWAEVALDEDFAALVEASDYQVFLTSYDPVLLFVQNRTARSFEIHTLPALQGKRAFSARCGYRIVGRRQRGCSGCEEERESSQKDSQPEELRVRPPSLPASAAMFVQRE